MRVVRSLGSSGRQILRQLRCGDVPAFGWACYFDRIECGRNSIRLRSHHAGSTRRRAQDITVRFADIKGSMDLMENLDPDETRTIVDPALKLMMDAVHHYGGYVAQSTGDSIFALFGAPVAHEDHPQCALYAALRLQDQLKRYSDTLRGQGRLPLQARVGLNTGEVVVRSIATGEDHTEYTPIGHSTSLAARMQALAPVGSIATTEQVRKLCEVTNRQTAGRAARFDSRRAQGSR
jgi:class 3 adenylate cyclase